MTETEAPLQTRRRRRRPRTVVLSVLILAALAVGVSWPVAASVSRGAVVIREDARPWVCQSGTVRTANLGDGDSQDLYTSLLTVAPGLRCELRIIVDNIGSHPVTVNRVTVPFLGQASAVEVAAVQLDGNISTVTPDPERSDTVDASFTIPTGLQIDGGTTEVLSVTVAYKDKQPGCSLQAGSSMFGMNSTLDVTAWGIPGEVTERSSTFGFTGPKSCP